MLARRVLDEVPFGDPLVSPKVPEDAPQGGVKVGLGVLVEVGVFVTPAEDKTGKAETINPNRIGMAKRRNKHMN